MMNQKNKRKDRSKLGQKLDKSPINYYSDLFIVAMVLLWIFDNVYQSLIASAVTISSIIQSFQTGMVQYDTSMWSSIGNNVAIPLSCGGAIWMIKNSVQHAIANSKGKRAFEDFPAVDTENIQPEKEMEFEETVTAEATSAEVHENEGPLG